VLSLNGSLRHKWLWVMLLAHYVLYKVDSNAIISPLVRPYIRTLLLSNATIFRYRVFLVLVEHIINFSCIQWINLNPIKIIYRVFIKYYYEVEIFSNWEKLSAHYLMRFLYFKEGPTPYPWILKLVFIAI